MKPFKNKCQNLIVGMASSCLTKAKLSKKFWYWAVHEANVCSNIFPVSQMADNTASPDYLTTPYYDFFGKKSGYHIIFPFGDVMIFGEI